MIFQDTGQVAPGFHVLGSAAVPSYLLDGPRPLLFEAGFSCLGPLYERSARAVLGQRRPEALLLTHVHFDHCGGAAYLRGAFPGLKVAGSSRAGRILGRPGALDLIAQLNQAAAESAQVWQPGLELGPPFAPFSLDLQLSDGQKLDLGLEAPLQVLATPGHTWDHLSYYLPHAGILVAGEAAGCPDTTGYIFTEFLVDYQAYVDSVKRLAGLEVELLCLGHHYVYTGKEARTHFGRSLAAAREFKEWVEHLLATQGGDLARVMELVQAQEWDPKPEPKQPMPAYLLNLEARVRHLASGLGLELA